MSKPCVFCGKVNDFLMFCEGVCMNCGDQLQIKHGLIVQPVGAYDRSRAEVERMEKALAKIHAGAVMFSQTWEISGAALSSPPASPPEKPAEPFPTPEPSDGESSEKPFEKGV